VIEWVTWVIVAVAIVQALLAVGFAIAGSPPNDYTLGLTLLLALAMIVQVIITVSLQVSGVSPTGDIVEFWAYLGTAVLLAPAAIVWGLIDRSRWSTVALAVVGFSLAVMEYRMHEIWFVQVA
jgi:asparagine N-glycosylation enzyme membrane subunit Stt3